MGSAHPLLPPGYRFAPTDEELVKHYLGNKVSFKPLPAGAITEIDADVLYSKPPHAIVDAPRGDTREWYYFIRNNKHEHEHLMRQEEFEYVTTQKKALKEHVSNFIDEQEVSNFIDEQENEVIGCARHKDANNIQFLEQGTIMNWIGKFFKEEEKENNAETIKNGSSKKLQVHKNKVKSNIQRVGNSIGFWKSVGSDDLVYATENVSAFKIHYIYFEGSMRKSKKTHWRMDEYHLVCDQQDLNKEEWVLGRITRGRDYRSYY